MKCVILFSSLLYYSLLRELHWLPVHLRVDFKILLVTFKVLHGIDPFHVYVNEVELEDKTITRSDV